MEKIYPVVEFKSGKVKGFVARGTHKNAKDVSAFRGIPFAEPPIGKLRFMPPKPYTKTWDGVLDGTKFSKAPRCPVKFVEMLEAYFPLRVDLKAVYSEDCLYLDIYTPTNAKPGANLPVMVFFYGGGFSMGSCMAYDGTVLSGMNDVILVVPNYRVNVFGFLTLGKNSCCSGNAGLLDQRMALLWVQENIKEFGGNPDNVTIFGESAGSMSVGYHVNSPMSKGLFHKAIFHSGTATSTVPTNGEKGEALQKFLKKLKIEDEKDEVILSKLQEVDENKLQAVFESFLPGLAFLPIIDGKFIPMQPKEILHNRTMNNVPVIVGYNDSEGMGMMGLTIPKFFEGFEENEFENYLKMQMKVLHPDKDSDIICKKIKENYMKSQDPNDKLRYSKAYGKVLGDTIFEASSIKHAKTFSKIMPTYVYLGAFQLKMFHNKEFAGEIGQKPDWANCDHSDDLLLSFGSPFAPFKLTHNPKFDKNEERISIEFMKYLTNFAKTGNPNEGENVEVNWPKFDCINYSTLKLGTEKTEVIENNSQKEMIEFWDSI